MKILGMLGSAVGDIDLTAGLTAAGTAISSQVNAALPIALPIGAGLLAVTIGWKFFRRFVRG